MPQNWSALEGLQIEGDLVLRSFTRARENQAEFSAGDGSVEVHLLPADDPGAEAQLSRWQEAAALSHPSLLTVQAAGRSRVGDVDAVYCITEAVEDRVADLIPDRPMTAEEAAEVVGSVASALEYLHGKGFAHRAVSADAIVAVGGRVKLTVDAISQDGSAPRDMRDLGATVVEILTQKRTRDAAEVPASMPSPFRQIAIGCLQPDQSRRWNIGQVQAALAGNLPAESVAPAPALTVERPSSPPEPRAARGGSWLWIAVAAGVAVVLLVLFLRRPERETPVAAPVQAQVPLPSPVAKHLPSPESPAPPMAAPVTRARAEGQWGVVAAAYRDYDAAQRRAASMAEKWSGFTPEVRPEKGEGSKYYVVLGSQMSRTDAEALLRKARSAGLPRDAYVTRFTR